MRDAVVDAASVGAGLWLSYLFLFFYLVIAAAASPTETYSSRTRSSCRSSTSICRCSASSVLGPALFLIVHAYVLLHFVMLAGKVGAFHAELQAQIADEETRARLRRQLPSNIFVQYLAGPHEVRTGVMGFMLRLIALITLVTVPIALLVFFQLQFLPYHSAAITWWQRIAVLIDIVAVVDAVALDLGRATDMDLVAGLSASQGSCAGAGEPYSALAGLHHRDLPGRMAGNTLAIAAASSDQMAILGIGARRRPSKKARPMQLQTSVTIMTTKRIKTTNRLSPSFANPRGALAGNSRPPKIHGVDVAA